MCKCIKKPTLIRCFLIRNFKTIFIVSFVAVSFEIFLQSNVIASSISKGRILFKILVMSSFRYFLIISKNVVAYRCPMKIFQFVKVC